MFSVGFCRNIQFLFVSVVYVLLSSNVSLSHWGLICECAFVFECVIFIKYTNNFLGVQCQQRQSGDQSAPNEKCTWVWPHLATSGRLDVFVWYHTNMCVPHVVVFKINRFRILCCLPAFTLSPSR